MKWGVQNRGRMRDDGAYAKFLRSRVELELRAPRVARTALALMVLSATAVGLPASFAPRAFFDDFPYIGSWVEKLPPYNEHLITDVGGLYLALAVIAGWAAWKLERQLARAVSAGWLVAAALHWAFHVRHLGELGTADAVGQTASLTAYLLMPVVVLWAVSAAPPAGQADQDA